MGTGPLGGEGKQPLGGVITLGNKTLRGGVRMQTFGGATLGNKTFGGGGEMQPLADPGIGMHHYQKNVGGTTSMLEV